MKLLTDDLEPQLAAASPDQTAGILDYLEQHLPDYPFRRDIDRPFVEELVADFPHVDLLEQIKAFRWYYDNQPVSRLRKPRLALRRWLVNARPRP